MKCVTAFMVFLLVVFDGACSDDHLDAGTHDRRPYIIGVVEREERTPSVTTLREHLLDTYADKTVKEQVELAKTTLSAHRQKAEIVEIVEISIEMLIRIKCSALKQNKDGSAKELKSLKKLLPFFEVLAKDDNLKKDNPHNDERDNKRLVKVEDDRFVYRENPFVELVEELKKQ